MTASEAPCTRTFSALFVALGAASAATTELTPMRTGRGSVASDRATSAALTPTTGWPLRLVTTSPTCTACEAAMDSPNSFCSTT